MTREEAIEFFKQEKFKNVNSKYRRDWNDASDMAIEALQDDTAVTMIKELAEVVRCKDCRFYWGNLSEDDTDEMYGKCRWDSDEMPDADDFCSYGERREE